MNPFYFLVFLLTVTATCPVQAAILGDSVSFVEIFTTREQKVRSKSHTNFISQDQGIELQIYLLDGIQEFDSVLSKQLPTEFKQAKHNALQRLQQIDVKLMEAMQQTAIGLTRAMQYGLNRYPAVVFDGKAVVNGVTDLETALKIYRKWLSESQQ
jgi:integrating conjugative element protein (TIGR03757 family)